ncbi:hypothetical protein COB21_05830 [Candidatus Aerophobetes bacterium]|uniref:Glycosyl transferase n=1 Tax=Aerophobetes bacterium TaxID=2030807 RepID=A0A2A4WZP1_UNCAE|nr:MAG: hypothetical protein COB21_05830 [Candidatus Aerophobetes bacterium]
MQRLFLKFLFACSLVCLISGCEKKPNPVDEDSFSFLMGDQEELWQFVKTNEDFSNLEFFEKNYEATKLCKADLHAKPLVPKTVHFIWVGPNNFPETSIDNVVSWVNNNPNFKFKFWTDRLRPLPHPSMELELVSNFPFQFFEKEFVSSTNWAEKSDLLRYEILYQQGGIYVDHDVICLNSFEELTHTYDLFCGMEPPHQLVLNTSINLCNNLIGSAPAHPVLKETIERVSKRWKSIEKIFPGKDTDSTIMRIAHRTFSPFDEAFQAKASQLGNNDIAFPANFFNNMGKNPGKYAHHYYASTWFDDEPAFEKNLRRRLTKISRKNNQILLFNAFILAANLFLVVFLLRQKHIFKRYERKN